METKTMDKVRATRELTSAEWDAIRTDKGLSEQVRQMRYSAMILGEKLLHKRVEYVNNETGEPFEYEYYTLIWRDAQRLCEMGELLEEALRDKTDLYIVYINMGKFWSLRREMELRYGSLEGLSEAFFKEVYTEMVEDENISPLDYTESAVKGISDMVANVAGKLEGIIALMKELEKECH